VDVTALDWTDASSWPSQGTPKKTQTFDVILGCDLVYDRLLVPHLTNVVASLLAERGLFLYVCGQMRLETVF
jgi:hypothetical protein